MIIPGLTAKDSSMIIDLLSDCKEVDKAILYGSRAIGNFKPGSDIDIAVIGSGLNLRLLNDLSESYYGLPLPYSLDLSIFQQINNPELLDHISTLGITIYNKNQQTE